MLKYNIILKNNKLYIKKENRMILNMHDLSFFYVITSSFFFVASKEIIADAKIKLI